VVIFGSRRGRKVLAEVEDALARIGRERGDVNQPGDLRIGAGLGVDGAAVGMAAEQDRPVLERDRPLDGSDVVREGRQRILDRDDVQAGLLQDWDDLGPTRAIRPRAVDEDHVSHRGLRRVGRGGQCSENEQRQETTGDRHERLRSGYGNQRRWCFIRRANSAERRSGRWREGYVMVARAGFAPAIPANAKHSLNA